MSTPASGRKRDELLTAIFICAVFFPGLTVALVGTYGLIVWLSHALGG